MDLENIAKANELIARLTAVTNKQIAAINEIHDLLNDYVDYMQTEIERLRDAAE